jgi:hypothetical protein
VLRRTPLKRRGPVSNAWKAFRDAEAVKDRDEEGILHCQDYLIGLPRCGVGLPELDLHNTQGRSGKLLFDKSKMVWLTRDCHRKAHNDNS